MQIIGKYIHIQIDYDQHLLKINIVFLLDHLQLIKRLKDHKIVHEYLQQSLLVVEQLTYLVHVQRFVELIQSNVKYIVDRDDHLLVNVLSTD